MKKAINDKMVRKMLRTGAGKAALQRAGLYLPERPEYEKARPRVCMLVPSYSGPKSLMQEAAGAMIDYSKRWVDIWSPPRIASSVVHWVRNHILADVMVSGEPFDHVLFIDDDIVPQPDALMRLLSHKKDIVAALCTKRVDPPIPNMLWLEESMDFSPILKWKIPNPLMKVDAAGTGMMLISREAIEAVAEFHMRCGWERQVFGRMFNRALDNAFAKADGGALLDPALRHFAELAAEDMERQLLLEEEQRRETYRRTGNAQWFQFLQKLNNRGEYGEDVSFCFKARFCGIDTHTDTSVTPGHIGDYVYSIDDYAPYQDLMTKAKVREERVPIEEEASKIILTD